MNRFKLTKKKMFISLIPFIPVLFMPIFLVDITDLPYADHLYFVIMPLLSIQMFLMVIAYGSIVTMAYPLKPILMHYGMWEYHSSLFIAASGPEVSVSGMILTALFYSIILYILLSLFSKSKQEVRPIYCVECDKKKKEKFCKHCQKETGDLCKLGLVDGFEMKEALGIERRKSGISRYIRKTFQGFQKSGDIKKHPKGVERHMDIDRENDWYDETVKDNQTGKVFRNVHEPLSKHISSAQKKKP